MKITIDIDRADLGIIRVALLDALVQAETNRNCLDGIDGYEDFVARCDHRIAVLTAVKKQIGDYEVAMLSGVPITELKAMQK